MAQVPANLHQPSMDSTITITPRGEERIRNGHFWMYRADVAAGSASPGDVVRIVGPRGRFLAKALYSDRSQITLRLLTQRDVPVDRAFWRARFLQAIAFRDRIAIEASAYRVVHGEGDLIPSLVVDRYGDYLVVQALSQGTDRLQPLFVDILKELLHPTGILARNDPRVRLLEGLDQRVDGAGRRGSGQGDGYAKDRSQYDVDLRGGQKTGAFLDQRENRLAAAGYVHGRVLDCFSYAGGFSLQLARRATELTALDISEEATTTLAHNAKRNGLVERERENDKRVRRTASAGARGRALRYDRAGPARIRQDQGRR